MVEGDSDSQMVIGLHQFTLEKYSLFKGGRPGQPIHSDSFIVGGHHWAISVFPDGIDEGNNATEGGGNTSKGGNVKREGECVYMGLCVTLMSEIDDGVPCFLEIRLLDQSGRRNHKTESLFDNDEGPILMFTNKHNGFPRFIRRNVLEKSCYLRDDCLKIECKIGVVLPSETDTDSKPTTSSSEVSLCDDGVGFDFLAILETGEGSDVVFKVKGEKFRAHKVILSARSSVFQSMFARNQPEEIVITGVEPRVFKVLLHFIYGDNLPEDETPLADAYAFGKSVSTTFAANLLAAADKYNVSRLKVICESHLWRSISLNCFAETLLLAERYNASTLKHLCFEYAADTSFYAALVELDSFTCLQKNGRTSLLKELDDYLLSKGMPLSQTE